QEPFLGFESQIRQCLIIGASHLAVDLHEARHDISRAAGIKLINHLLYKLVVDLQITNSVLGLLALRERVGNVARSFVARWTRSIDHWRRIRRHVPRIRKEREEAWPSVRHRPGAKSLVSDTYTRLSPIT